MWSLPEAVIDVQIAILESQAAERTGQPSPPIRRSPKELEYLQTSYKRLITIYPELPNDIQESSDKREMIEKTVSKHSQDIYRTILRILNLLSVAGTRRFRWS